MITPKTIAAVRTRDSERDRSQQVLHEAVLIANGFLCSKYRKTLPPGGLRLTDDGMTFVTAGAEQPLRIKCSVAGDILIPLHFAAWERSWGFVVGYVPPRQSRAIDNSLFKDSSGRALANYQVTRTILHELTHSYHKVGTVSFGKGVMYYMEGGFSLLANKS